MAVAELLVGGKGVRERERGGGKSERVKFRKGVQEREKESDNGWHSNTAQLYTRSALVGGVGEELS